MAAKRKKMTLKTLAQGRPPISRKPKSISRKATRTLINAVHRLEKKKSQALSSGDQKAMNEADAEMTALGGIERYQQASLQGQRQDRGGDSSRILMDWLEPILSAENLEPNESLHMLEVGALSTRNECSKRRFFKMERIDLNSQSNGITQQNFMERPMPISSDEQFDVISLSLVLNFVPDAQGRGNMLLRTLDFLKEPERTRQSAMFPCLFLVLPAPCVTNSRYMDEPLLENIMTALGYSKTHHKITNKLVYYLWTRTLGRPTQIPTFTKTELRSGSTRNNFSIILRG